MKKVRIIILFMTLFLGMFFFMPVGVSAYTYNPDKNGQDFTPYKNDIYYCELEEQYDIYVKEDGTVLVTIRQGLNKQFQFHKETDFSSAFLPYLFSPGAVQRLRDVFGVDKIYWNPWQQLWQLEYPVEENITAVDWINHISQFDFGFAYGEIDYSGDILIVEETGHEYEGYWIEYSGDVDWFEPELAIIEQLVEDGVSVSWYLEENFEDFDGYLYWNFEQGYWQIEYYELSELDYYKQRVEDLEGLLVNNNDIDIIKWFVPLVVIIIVVGVFESIKIFKRRDE